MPHLLPASHGGRQELREKQDDRRHESLGCVVKEGVLSVLRCVPVRADDGLGEDLGILLRLGSCSKIFRMLPADVHVVVDERQQVEPVRAGRISEIDDRNLVIVIIRCHGAVIPREVALGVQREKAHAAGAGIFEVGIKEKRSLADTGRADHETVDVVTVHHGCNGVFLPRAAEDESLRVGGQFFAFAPERGLERDVPESSADFALCRPARRAVLPVANSLGLDSVQRIVVGQKQDRPDHDAHHGHYRNQGPYIA